MGDDNNKWCWASESREVEILNNVMLPAPRCQFLYFNMIMPHPMAFALGIQSKDHSSLRRIKTYGTCLKEFINRCETVMSDDTAMIDIVVRIIGKEFDIQPNSRMRKRWAAANLITKDIVHSGIVACNMGIPTDDICDSKWKMCNEVSSYGQYLRTANGL